MKRTLAFLLTLSACRSSPGAPPAAQSVTAGIQAPALGLSGHPRLWMRAADVPRLRSWATHKNPAWNALVDAAEHARADVDGGQVPLKGACAAESGAPCEQYAELFAFMSVVSPSEKERRDWGQRAVKMLMAVIDHVAAGPPTGREDPLRNREFAVDDRSRWYGEAFGLTVDWAYPYFSAEQKRRIHDVFLRWADQISHAVVTNHNHPEPLGVVDDPRLVADKITVRWAGNNYYTAHARNLGLMALALDSADDPGGRLGAYLKSVTGAWLYVIDALLRGDARGGLPPDGLEYGPQTYAYVSQLLLALHTAGKDDVATWGRQARMGDNPWWKGLVAGWPHILAPATEPNDIGPVYRPAWWGEAQDYWAPDPIDMMAPVALYFRDIGDNATADAAQWITVHTAPGGADGLYDRAAKADTFRRALLPFLMIDPTAKKPADPRRGTVFVDEGLGKIFARTDWSPKATFFDYMIGWNSVDHMHNDANSFDWYRRGEWLVKERTGYGWHATSSDAHNTICIQNALPYHGKDHSDYRYIFWQRGSQWDYDLHNGDGKLIAHSETPRYVYGLGLSTDCYNSESENSTDIAHASRAIVWLVPDHVVILDRAATKVDGRFKRFWLNLSAPATVSGRRATVKTKRGQLLYVNTLLPADAKISPQPGMNDDGEPAHEDPMIARLMVESWAKDVRFLHVLQAADGGAPESPALVDAGPTLLAATAGDTVVVFPRDFGADVADVSFAPPAGARNVLVTGLAPNGDYKLFREGGRVRITRGTGARADGGGVLYRPIP